MRHNLYMNCNNHGFRSGGKRVGSDYSRQPPKHRTKTINPISRKFVSLDNLANTVLEKYNDDPIIRDEIVGKINLYRVNFTIAQDFKDLNAQKELTNGIRNYLYDLLKKEL